MCDATMQTLTLQLDTLKRDLIAENINQEGKPREKNQHYCSVVMVLHVTKYAVPKKRKIEKDKLSKLPHRIQILIHFCIILYNVHLYIIKMHTGIMANGFFSYSCPTNRDLH